MSTGAEYRYVYDDLGQLLREDNTVTNKTYVYEYDDAGNITSKKTYALTAEGATPSSLVSSVTYGYTDPLGWGDLLTSYGGGSITYDVIGNPLTYYNGNSYTFEWENGRQLAAVSSDDFELEFVYNDEGIRTQKIANGAVHTYHLSGSQIISEEWGNHLLVYLYDSNGSPMGMQYRRSSMAEDVFYTFWFEKNLQGDIVAVYNSAGTKVVSYAYDAWGNCIVTNHNISGTNSYANLNPFRYRGYYYDNELGFYYLNSRYYDPSVCRFINADALVSTGQGLLGYNMFAYCGNNPVLYTDQTGNSPESSPTPYKNKCLINRYTSIFAVCVVGSVVGGSLIGVLLDTADEISSAIKSAIDKAIENAENNIKLEPRDQSVYALYDPNDNNLVKYIGRTNNPSRRLNEHQNDNNHPERAGYRIAVFCTGLSVNEARVVEQVAISAFTIVYLENARREIAVGNVRKYQSYMNAIKSIIANFTVDEIISFLEGQ